MDVFRSMTRRRGGECARALTAVIALAVVGVAPALGIASSTAHAQQTVIVGGSGLPEVEVNLGALDRLGPPPGPRRLLPPPGPGADRDRVIHLTPPSSGGAPSVATSLTPPPPPPTLKPPTATPAPTPAPVATTTPAPASTPAPTPTPSVTAAKPLAPAPAPTVNTVPIPEPEPTPEPTPTAPATEPVTPPTPAVVAVPKAPVAQTAPAPQTQASAPPTPEPQVAAPEAPPAAPAPSTAPAPQVTTSQPKTTEPQVAAVPPAQATAPIGDSLRIAFTGDSATLPAIAKKNLRALAERMKADDSLRAQVKAYAGGSSGSPSAARRLSLSRALAVRAYLIEQNVRSTRIDVRALGNRFKGGPSERVDIVLVNR